MKKNENNLVREIFVCECHSLDHQFAIWYDDELNQINIEPHLSTNKNFLKRIAHGIKYMFGYKSRYGDWDSTIINNDDIPKLIKYLNKVKR